MKARSSKMIGRRASARKAARGSSEAGVAYDPTKSADEPDVQSGAKKAAPAPGVPMSQAEYEKLKRDAETARKPPSRHSQEDPATKK